MAEFKYTITKKIAVLSGNEKSDVEFNCVQWGEMAPKYDIRKWRAGIPVKGISLDEAEAKALYAALKKEFDK